MSSQIFLPFPRCPSSDGDVRVRFDTIDMLVVSENRDFLKYHVNAFGREVK